MTSLCANLATLLLFLSPLMHSHHFIHAASTSPPLTRPRIIFINGLGSDDDYEDDYNDNHSPPPKVLSSMRTPLLRREPQLCQYDSCSENQEPCALLSEATGCLCPGVSGPDELPHAPRIETLLPVSQGNDKGKIEVQWCAPSSVVSFYRVVVEGHDGNFLEYGNALRRGVVGSLEVGTKVCVEAVNDAGQSTASEFSCKRYEAPESSDQKLLAWVIGGGVVLLLLFVIAAVILWKCRICRKAKRDSADGLGNPSYSTEGTL
ncbi:leucine-rich repeat neuronal protein 4 [Acanthochromis polyacanthus]|uniref:Leucine-rich repeat neuronal protein 4-like n=1 Tax=Acanthochromis polyacanthus TaxID=80966 RepID=A0A3Q1H2C9_9TELE|nr:leucine-rich repeat neuronal protein 4 [Acanthochromis polyacanthus]